MVEFLTPLDTRAYEADEFVVLRDYELEFDHHGRRYRLTIPRGFITDLGSQPWLVQALPGFGVNGNSRDAAVPHDFGYSSAGDLAVLDVTTGEIVRLKLTRREVDQLFYDGLIASGYSRAVARLFYLGVRAGGWWYWRQRRGGIRYDYDFVPETYWNQPCTHCGATA